MENFFKNLLNNFTLFDAFPKDEKPFLSLFWAFLGSMFWYLFVAVAGWDSIWLPYAITFLWIWIFKSVLKTVWKEEAFRYNLLLEICLYFVAVVAFRFLYEN